MSKFKFKKRAGLDKVLANEGIDFPIKDQFGEYVGKFKCRYVDMNSDNGMKQLKRVKTMHGIEDEDFENDQFRVLATIFIEMNLLDWEMEGEDGKPVPYSKEAAYAFFTDEDNRAVLASIMAKSREPKNYGIIAPEETAGN